MRGVETATCGARPSASQAGPSENMSRSAKTSWHSHSTPSASSRYTRLICSLVALMPSRVNVGSVPWRAKSCGIVTDSGGTDVQKRAHAGEEIVTNVVALQSVREPQRRRAWRDWVHGSRGVALSMLPGQLIARMIDLVTGRLR